MDNSCLLHSQVDQHFAWILEGVVVLNRFFYFQYEPSKLARAAPVNCSASSLQFLCRLFQWQLCLANLFSETGW